MVKLQKLNSKVKIIKLDVQNDLSIQLAAEQINYELDGGGINCLINNAGILEMVGFRFASFNFKWNLKFPIPIKFPYY